MPDGARLHESGNLDDLGLSPITSREADPTAIMLEAGKVADERRLRWIIPALH